MQRPQLPDSGSDATLPAVHELLRRPQTASGSHEAGREGECQTAKCNHVLPTTTVSLLCSKSQLKVI